MPPLYGYRLLRLFLFYPLKSQFRHFFILAKKFIHIMGVALDKSKFLISAKISMYVGPVNRFLVPESSDGNNLLRKILPFCVKFQKFHVHLFHECKTIYRTKIMKTKNEENTVKLEQRSGFKGKKRKSKITLFWEKYPNGILEIVDRKAVLR